MTRWAPGAAGRLHTAAIQLFLEQGFSSTTVPQIAERAGLTTRSFFRYYADKREVLFAGEDELPDVVVQIFQNADPKLSPMEVIHSGLKNVVIPRLERSREEFLVRRAILSSDEGLQERELRKLAILHRAATAAFARRGLSPLDANIAGRLAVTVYDTTLELWLADDIERPMVAILDNVVHALGHVASSSTVGR
ncbi:MAG: helix-turn-helix domain-containing protein [Terracoccus sp.]